MATTSTIDIVELIEGFLAGYGAASRRVPIRPVAVVGVFLSDLAVAP